MGHPPGREIFHVATRFFRRCNQDPGDLFSTGNRLD
jgi:hypothetical protein